MRMTEQDQMADVMKDQHRERIQEQISREKNRQYQEQKMVELSREAKKNVRYVFETLSDSDGYEVISKFESTHSYCGCFIPFSREKISKMQSYFQANYVNTPFLHEYSC